jgi:hypothetical protein
MLRMEEKEEKGSHVVWGGLAKFTTTDAVVVVEKTGKISRSLSSSAPPRERVDGIYRSFVTSFLFYFFSFFVFSDWL